MRFDEKTAIVTGASRGIGRACALALAGEGCNVVANYEKNREGADRVVEVIRAANEQAIAARCDVSNKSEVEAMFKAAVDEFGKVDILVNNAAVYSEAPLLNATEEVWDRTVDVNLKGVFLCMQAAARHMVPRGYGMIVNISSIAGFGVSGLGEAAY